MNQGLIRFLVIFLVIACSSSPSANAMASKLPTIPDLTGPTPAPLPPMSGQVLKVLQLNLNSGDVQQDSNDAIRDRQFAALVQWVYANSPDVVFLEGAWNYRGWQSVIIPLAEEVGYDYFYRLDMGFPGIVQDSDGFLVKKQFHLGQQNNVELPGSAPEIGNGTTWQISLGNVSYAVGGRIVLQDNSPMYLFATHLVNGDQSQRDADMVAIDDAIQIQVTNNGEDWPNTRALIGGNLNSNPNAPGLLELSNRGYQDTFAAAHPELPQIADVACTICGNPASVYFDPMTIAPGLSPLQNTVGTNDRYDYILARGPGIQELASTVEFTNTANNLWLSDHYGVMSTLLVGGNGGAAPVIDNPVRAPAGDVSNATSLVIHLTDSYFNCIGPCTNTLTETQISAARGVTFINDSSYDIHITLSGGGNVWSRSWVFIGSGDASTFYFDPNQTYQFEAKRVATLKILKGQLDATLP